MKEYLKILFIAIIPIVSVAFFFGCSWNGFGINSALAYYEGYNQSITDTDISAATGKTGNNLGIVFLLEDATTQISNFKIAAQGTCGGSGYPKICFDTNFNCTGELDDFNSGTVDWIDSGAIDITYSSGDQIKIFCGSGSINLYGESPPRSFYSTSTDMYSRDNIGLVLDDYMIGFEITSDLIEPVTPENEYLTIPDPTLDQWRSDINTAYDHICFLDEPCEIWFSFNDKAIGNTVYMTPYSPPEEQFPAYAEASTTIEWVGFWQTHVDLDARSVATTTKHCIFLEDSVYGDFRLCGITTKWIGEDEFMDGLEFPITCNCDSVATSTGSFWDDMRYGVECGSRELFCWMFLEVDPDAIAHFKNKVKQLEQSFPLNTFFSITDAAQDAMSSTTLNSEGSLDAPFMDEDKNLTFVPVMTSSSMPNLIGEENNNYFRLIQMVFLWSVTAAFLIIFSIRKFI